MATRIHSRKCCASSEAYKPSMPAQSAKDPFCIQNKVGSIYHLMQNKMERGYFQKNERLNPDEKNEAYHLCAGIALLLLLRCGRQAHHGNGVCQVVGSLWQQSLGSQARRTYRDSRGLSMLLPLTSLVYFVRRNITVASVQKSFHNESMPSLLWFCKCRCYCCCCELLRWRWWSN